MKKFIYSMCAVIALGFAFVSCGDDDEDEVINYTTTPEQASAGTYSGTWTRTLNGVSETGSGTVTLSAGSTVGVTNITFTCESFGLNGTSVANITNANHGFQFVQQITSDNPANTVGSAFAGQIDANGNLITSLNVDQRNGRVLVTYVYTFAGSK